jgi:hypothetical protein
MAKQIINVGTAANSKNGDPLRTAFTKVNANFTELYGSSGTTTQLTNGSYTAVLNNSGVLTVPKISITGSGTALNVESGNILTNQITGTQINLLSGAYTIGIATGGTTASYTLNLPVNAGTADQVLKTDGTGNLSWTTLSSGLGSASSAWNVLGPTVTLGAISAKIVVDGHPALSATSNINVAYSYTQIIAGTHSAGRSVNTALSTGSFTNIGSSLASVGDITTIIVQDPTNSKAYRVTFIATANISSGYGSVSIERII